jgi:7-dehydrocholesterol reductase
VLLEFVPGKKIFGPLTPTGELPEYTDNGMKCWFITHVLWLALGPFGLDVVNFGAVYDHWGAIIAVASMVTTPFCIFLYFKGRYYPSSRDAQYTGRPAFDFFQGVELHPRLFGVNLKQLLNCRVSMNMWSISQLCFMQAQMNRGQLCSSMVVLAALHVLYIAKFFWWEAGYFASIDIILDRCGYYIVWGVLCWVPSVYCSPGFTLVENPVHWSLAKASIIFGIGILALVTNYITDYQRQITRATHGNCLIWGKKPKVIVARYRTSNDNKTHESLLLCSGFWGWSRHFNYVPELILSFAWSWGANSQLLLPWVYWLFLFFLLIDRTERDDEKCRAKYGKHWEEYCKQVLYKFIPYVY